MRILIAIGHPAHVHFYKYFIRKMKNKGHTIGILTRDRKTAIDLLDIYGFDYNKLASPDVENPFSLKGFKNYTRFIYENYKVLMDFQPDICTGIGMLALNLAAVITDANSIVFTDTEHAKLQNNITFPFANQIYTPDCYLDDLGAKQIRYPGYHELAYLHPNRFEPDPSVLELIDANKDDKIVILRLISWEAAHDVGHQGFDNVVDVVHELESTGAQVVITSEGNIPKEIEYCQSEIPVHKMHDLMYYSSLYIGEGGTMAIESSVLGTPAIFVSSLSAGVFEELDNKYGLLFNYSGPDKENKSLSKSLKILKDYDKQKWKKRKEKLLEDKIDTTEFIIKEIKKWGKQC